MTALLYLLFFLSGGAALMYEAVWTRYLGLLVGHDAYAQVLVLVIFLGGMSGGAWLVSRRTTSFTHPLRAYALIEGAVGLIGLLFHDVFTASAAFAYATLFPMLRDSALLEPAKWALAGLLILPQSLLLGATFPLMSAGVLRLRRSLPGRVLSLLYFTNSLGGAVGVLLAGFVLLEAAGLPGVLSAAAAINLVVALGAFLIARQEEAVPAAPLEHAAVATPLATRIPIEPLLLAIAFATALASFAYQIDWIRMLSLVLGSATHSFELMLSAFILGLALGALYIQRRLDTLEQPVVTLAKIQLAMGALAILTLPIYVASFSWTATFLQTFMRTGEGYTGYTLLRYAICLVVMLPSTFCAGMTLPLITRMLVTGGSGERAIGRVYSWNTAGSIAGALLAGLVLLPVLGLKMLLLGAGALDMALGIALLVAVGRRDWVIPSAAGAVAVVVIVALFVPLDRALLTSGVFRSGRLNTLSESSLRYYADGRTATVAVGAFADGSRLISTNGKTDASMSEPWRVACDSTTVPTRLGGDEITQTLLPLVTLAYRPDARRAAVIGFGSGMSSHFLLASRRLDTVTTIEIEPRMIEGARHFLPANHRVYDDPRSQVVVRDAKAHFASSGRQWDLILSEPSNPWVSGVAGLFTEEFYARIRSALAEGGVFGQWLHTYELSDPLVLTVLAALDRAFPSWQLHQVGPGDLLIVASTTRLPAPQFDRIAAMPGLEADFCRLLPIAGSDLESVMLGGNGLLAPLLSRVGQPNSDFYPTLDLGAERARFQHESASGFISLGRDWFNLSRALVGVPDTTVAARRIPFDGISRATNAWIREGLETADTVDGYREHARWTWQQWHLLMRSDDAPTSWDPWLDVMRNASELRHGSVAGSADSAFFARATAVATRWHAPVWVSAVITFRRAVQSWNAPLALAAAETIRTSGRAGTAIPFDELRDGAIVMALRNGDRTMAQRWLNAPGSLRSPDDLRSMLLAAWVRDGDSVVPTSR